jgi:hypothetical protein
MTDKPDLLMWLLCLILSLCMGMFWGALLYWLWPMAGLIVGGVLAVVTFALLVRLMYLPDPFDDDWTLYD